MAIGYLNIKSGYTFLKSTLKIKDLVKYGKDNNLPFLALTDFNNMFGAMEFYNECKKNNIKGIIGIEVKLDIYECNLVLIASGNKGYLSLCKLTSYITTSEFNKFVSLDQLNECKEGLIAILPCLRSNFNELNYEKRDQIINSLKSIFTSLYVGLEVYNDADVYKLDDIRTYSRSKNLPMVMCQEIVCINPSDIIALEVFDAIDKGKKVDEIDTKNYTNKYFLSDLKIKSIFSEEEIANISKIASLIEYKFEDIKGDLVDYPLDDSVDRFEYLRSLAIKGLQIRLSNKVTTKYYERIEYELKIIKQMDFVNYFLVVFDYVRFAKKNGILVGAGRGSCGGSLVCYCLGITNVDPIKYNLLFERFLNPWRITMPDIDVDFMDSRRDDVIEYIVNKYGKERIGRVVSFQTFKAKSALKDSAKALGLSLAESNELSKRVGDNDDCSLSELIKINPSFLSLIKTNDKYNKIYQVALKIEGLPRQTGMHAAGIICNNKPLYDVIPVYNNNYGLTLSQYDGNYIEAFHLYKMDILSLINLSIIDCCIKFVKQNKNIDINIDDINYDDPNIFTLFNKGLYGGIFQLDENSIKNAARQLKPTCLMDVVVCLSIGRPGPMEFIPSYVARKNGTEKIVYPHISLEPILKETYGIIIYQEQIMQIVTKMAGLSLGKADLVRRAISKKNDEKLKAEREDFINGCIKNKYSKEDAIKVFDTIEKFASYGFNKSHSVAYGMISVQMTYLKYYYPLEFFVSLLNVCYEESKIDSYLHELKIMNIKVLNPSINNSDLDFKIYNNAILYSLTKIKDINNQVARIIIDGRINNPYKSFIDFVKRTSPYEFKKEVYENLIKAGCFDEFGINKTTLLNNLDTILMYGSIVSKLVDGKLVISSMVSEPILTNYEKDIDNELNDEKNVLGFYLSSHPLTKFRDKLKEAGFVCISEIENGKRVKIVGKILRVKTINTKTNKSMAFVDVEDESGIVGLVLFAEALEKYNSILIKNNNVQILGLCDYRNNEPSIKVERLKEFTLGGN